MKGPTAKQQTLDAADQYDRAAFEELERAGSHRGGGPLGAACEQAAALSAIGYALLAISRRQSVAAPDPRRPT